MSNLSNVTAILFKLNDLNWAGFYLVQKDELVLGPFQGEVACTRIPFSKGVCGYTYQIKKTVVKERTAQPMNDGTTKYGEWVELKDLCKEEMINVYEYENRD